MALLDKYLDAMQKQGADALVFRTGASPEVLVRGMPRAVSAKTASQEQIQALLAEVLGAGFHKGLLPGTTANFRYQSPLGDMSIDVLQLDSTKLHAKIESARTAPPEPAAPSFDALDARALTFDSGPSPLPAAAPPAADDDGFSIAAAPPPAPPARVAAPSAPAPSAPSPISAAPTAGMPGHIRELFQQMIDAGASDLHLKGGKTPMLRVDGEIQVLAGRPVLSAQALEALVQAITPGENRAEFEATHDTDFAYELPGQARFRCNVFRDLAGLGAVFRQIPSKILTAEQLRLPKAVLDLCELEKGLVLVTGPTGSGKTTTLAAMIDYINASRTDHIITIEDPVEFVHPDKQCLVNQREVGKTTKSFKSALRAALREDPDVVLVGEMRDLETVAIAIETAETGHLVFGTLHTNTAASTVDRIIDQFPADRQSQIRTMLGESLKGVVSQVLLKKKGGGRVAALEILIVTSAISNMIREGKTFQINSMMQTGKGLGMQTLSDSMLDLVKAGIVEPQEAYDRSPLKKDFAVLLNRAGFKGAWGSEPG